MLAEEIIVQEEEEREAAIRSPGYPAGWHFGHSGWHSAWQMSQMQFLRAPPPQLGPNVVAEM